MRKELSRFERYTTCLRIRRRRFRTQRSDFKESPSAGRKVNDEEDPDLTDEDENMARRWRTDDKSYIIRRGVKVMDLARNGLRVSTMTIIVAVITVKTLRARLLTTNVPFGASLEGGIWTS